MTHRYFFQSALHVLFAYHLVLPASRTPGFLDLRTLSVCTLGTDVSHGPSKNEPIYVFKIPRVGINI